ncbi:hypothetical protein ACIQU4_36015 [Streptomyces sp. NPDC090741]|uniref:hypothetical protein n=1 Tax=Streptomyces sp. NPDC090741 TaxID=3365967 RepID=UPI00382A0C73
MGLLAKAVDEDPQNELAQFEFVWAAYGLQLHEETDFGGFARAIYAQYDRSEVSKALDRDEGWMPLKIRILYSTVTQWVNGYGSVDAGDADRTEQGKIRDYAAELDRLCDPSEVAWKGKELQHQQAVMHLLARNLLDSLKALLDPLKEGQVTAIHSHEGPPASPRLAYDHACTHMLIARRKDLIAEARQQQMEYAIEDLRYAIVTEDDKKDAQGDPCLTGLQSDPRFRKLVNSTGTSGP